MNTTEAAAPSTGKRFFDLARDHVKLASLEWQYEKQNWRRRLLVRGGGAALLFCGFVFLQIAIIGGLLAVGMKIGWIGLLLFAVYTVSGVAMIKFFGKRDKIVGDAFQGTIEEIKRSVNWIEKNLF